MDPLSVEGEQNVASVRIVIIAGIAGGEGNRAHYDLGIRHIDCDLPASIIITADISKAVEAPSGTGDLLNTGAGSANGAAGGTVGTTTTASANSSQFVSSFAQAY